MVGVSDGVDGGDTGRLNAFTADLTNCSKRSTRVGRGTEKKYRYRGIGIPF